MSVRPALRRFTRHDGGQATLLGLGICLLAVALALILLAVGRVYVAHAELQQAADISASSLSRMQGDDPIAHARALARANGARSMHVRMEGGARTVVVRARAPKILVSLGNADIQAEATVQEVSVAAGVAAGSGAGGGYYSGPLVQVENARICPRVGAQYRAMQRSAAAAGITLYANSGYRSYAEQAALFAQLGPTLAAPPGTSLHHAATELDINVGPAGSTIHTWLASNAGRFGFIQRYSWEPWHWGNTKGC
jgi:D-alanyl-D-alanine carboxypeptidase/Putative Flp pilus-assembly TadE/G-like